jgi:hypothetical protein
MPTFSITFNFFLASMTTHAFPLHPQQHFLFSALGILSKFSFTSYLLSPKSIALTKSVHFTAKQNLKHFSFLIISVGIHQPLTEILEMAFNLFSSTLE